jgi:hypothetical protein
MSSIFFTFTWHVSLGKAFPLGRSGILFEAAINLNFIWIEVFAATKCNKIFSGYQPRQNGNIVLCFRVLSAYESWSSHDILAPASAFFFVVLSPLAPSVHSEGLDGFFARLITEGESWTYYHIQENIPYLQLTGRCPQIVEYYRKDWLVHPSEVTRKLAMMHWPHFGICGLCWSVIIISQSIAYVRRLQVISERPSYDLLTDILSDFFTFSSLLSPRVLMQVCR